MGNKRHPKLDAALEAYLHCAVWSSTDDNDEPLDAEYTRDDFTQKARAQARRELAAFLSQVGETEVDAQTLGTDFWLTRNGHGAGFWDRGLGEEGERLTALCRPYGSAYVYVTRRRLHFD